MDGIKTIFTWYFRVQTSDKICHTPGGTRPVFGYSWAAEGLKPWLCLGQKNPKIHTLHGKISSTLLPCLGKRTKCTPSCFKAHWQLQESKFMLQSLLLCTWSRNKFHQANEIKRGGNTLFIIRTDRLSRDYTPCLGQRGKSHTLSNGTSTYGPYQGLQSPGPNRVIAVEFVYFLKRRRF